MATVRGATLLGPDKLEVREYPIPDIPADGGLIKVEMGGVCGTDVKYLHGKLKVDYPIILGHEILGRVEKLGKNAAAIHHVKEGDRIILKGALGCGRCADCRRNNQRFCRQRTNYGGRTKCDQAAASVRRLRRLSLLGSRCPRTKISDALPAEAAALIGSVMANGFQWAIRRGGVKMGDYVLIQGPGQQGLSCTFASQPCRCREDFHHRHRTRQTATRTGQEVRRHTHNQCRRRRRRGSHPQGNQRRDVRRGRRCLGQSQRDLEISGLPAPPSRRWCLAA